MRHLWLLGSFGVGIAVPWAVAACGAPQEPSVAAAPIIVEPTAVSASPSSAPAPSAVASEAPPSPEPVASDVSVKGDAIDERGNMWGDAIGDAFGAGGLGLSTGMSDGGIGLGNIGTPGLGTGGRLAGATSPSLRQGVTVVKGRLPPEVIQRIVRQNFGRYRLCYENGLRKNPNLMGRVAVHFVIDKTGAVKSARDGGSDVPDQGVVACVVRGFANLSFPQPEKGEVEVTYPILFSPGSPAAAPSASASAKPPPKK